MSDAPFIAQPRYYTRKSDGARVTVHDPTRGDNGAIYVRVDDGRTAYWMRASQILQFLTAEATPQ